MNTFLQLAFLFFIGCVIGWGLEVIYRRFFSKDNEIRVWINPGFLQGPYLPLYGFGLCLLYILAGLENTKIISEITVASKLILFLIMAIVMTALEFIAGVIFIKGMKVSLWDYSTHRGNIMGIICPLFSFYWAVLGAIYYFLINPWVKDALLWFNDNLAFSFIVGMFFGVFIIDMVYSFGMIGKIRRFAKKHNVIVRYEALRTEILLKRGRTISEARLIKEQIKGKWPEKPKFMEWFVPFNSEIPLKEHLDRYMQVIEAFSEMPEIDEKEKRIGV